jgi:drug/metabolite transporter (DMT)-like permease
MTPVAVLLATWALRLEQPNLKVLGNVSVIVLGIIIASWAEIAFVMSGFVFQVFGIAFESVRLVMVQKLLSSPEYKMDPLVSLYYFAPVFPCRDNPDVSFVPP